MPDGAVPGKVSVTTPAGTATSAQDFSPTLSITGFSPTSGPPGTVVDIKGVGFTPGSSVKFNGTATVSYISPTEVKATVPTTASSGPITMTNTSAPIGPVRANSDYTLFDISSLSPSSGITGSQVTISGSGLNGATSVKFGSLQASFSVVSGTQVRATVPDGTLAGKISVTTPLGTATSAQDFVPSLSITSISPNGGPFGTAVAVRGVGFAPGAVVKFNGTAAATARYANSGEVQATVPATATTGPVTLSNTGAPVGTVQGRTSYTVTPRVAPTVTSFSPASTITGTKVIVTGTYLSGVNSIKFGSLAAPNFSVYSPTQLGVRVPAGAAAGPIVVTTAAGTATSSQSLTPSLAIMGFSPASGPVGTIVDIKGIGFTPASTVQFNTIPATTITYIGSGEVKATMPTGASPGPITITTAAGTVRSRGNYTVTTRDESTLTPARDLDPRHHHPTRRLRNGSAPHRSGGIGRQANALAAASHALISVAEPVFEPAGNRDVSGLGVLPYSREPVGQSP